MRATLPRYAVSSEPDALAARIDGLETLQESGADQEGPIDTQPRKIQNPQTVAFGDFGPPRACRRQALPGTLGVSRF